MSSTTEIEFRIFDVVDGNGQSTIMPEMDLPPSKNEDIAPWDEPPSPTSSKSPRGFGFPQKASFSSFRQGSFASVSHRSGRHSESPSTLSIPDGSSSSTSNPDHHVDHSHHLRKPKSGMFNFIRQKRSKVGLRLGDEHPSLRAPPVPDNSSYVSFLPASARPPTPHPPELSSKHDSKKKRRKRDFDNNLPPSLPPKDDELRLDTNFENLDGIVDPALWRSSGRTSPDSPSSSSHVASQSTHSRRDSSDHSFHSHGGISLPEFRDPFKPNSSPLPVRKLSLTNRQGIYLDRKVSPRTITPHSIPPSLSVKPVDGGASEDPAIPPWVPPESWAVQPDSEEPVDPQWSSEDEESVVPSVSTLARPSSSVASSIYNTSLRSKDNIDSALPSSLHPHRNRTRAATKPRNASTPIPKSISTADPEKSYTIRIYRANHTYHVVNVSFNVTVASLMPRLNQKLLLGEDRETHRLYLQERRRERVLSPTERPAEIVKRRLLQAGYDPSDGVEMIGGEGMSFLLRFVYKSEVLGTAEKDIVFDNYEYVDLTSRGLRAIPVNLHRHADSLVSLYLSRNPMLEIPLDFIQACTTLRELRLSHMAMKKVPHSVHESITLHRLDLSCNRISDLDDANLDYIPELQHLFLQNNRLDKLSWYFPRLRNLCTLNLSNNQFVHFPPIICELETLKDLDISFNSISDIPDEIAQMHNLERLIVVGNQVSRISSDFAKLSNLRQFDCRRNHISDLSAICRLPKLEKLSADHNKVHAVELCLHPHLLSLDASHNDLTKFTLLVDPTPTTPYSLTYLDVSNANLSFLDDNVFSTLISLRTVNLSHNVFKSIPETLGELRWLETLICSDNELESLPNSIGLLQKLETLDARSNGLRELPESLWQCASLLRINLTSNVLTMWHLPPTLRSSSIGDLSVPRVSERKGSATSQSGGHQRPPLAYSLEKLYLGENKFTDEIFHPLMILEGLRVLNLSFNHIQDLPNTFFRYFTKLEELYLSGNELTALPTEDLPKMTSLSVLFLNGNKLQTLPHELGKVKSLMTLDVGSNLLRYNINNWEFDWNWNFNKNLKYLNMSGNKRLQIKSDTRELFSNGSHRDMSMLSRQSLSGFTDLAHLRVLGLMDVTITTAGMGSSVDIPDENDDRRVRTSTVSSMRYGIADTLGKNEHLNMLDLVHEFPGRQGEVVFAMFGRAFPPRALANGGISNRLAKQLHDRFVDVFVGQLKTLKPSEGTPDALRRSFLRLNHELYDSMFSQPARKSSTASAKSMPPSPIDVLQARSGASGLVLYIADKRLYCANAGNILAVVSRSGRANPLSTKHDPYDRDEMRRIRMAEGWISPPGLVNDEIDLSRSFGFFHLYSLIARPDIRTWDLNELDEFVIIANRGLWDYVSYQSAVDIARRERDDPMIAAQKLRDFAMSYGAEGSTMIMVISVGDLFKAGSTASDPTFNSILSRRRRARDGVLDVNLQRLNPEIPPPTGHITMVFTDIVNSTGLWELNPGMRSALSHHHKVLRRHLRMCGGYEVKTEGDAFVVSFQTAVNALWWCMTIQHELLTTDWPLELLECDDGKPVYDSRGRLIARGMSIRMGVHCGEPICEMDPVTRRMDYLGPMVNRVARIEQSASGGQIQVSSDVIKELQMLKAMDSDADLDFSDTHLYEAVEAVRRMGIVVIPVGEVKLKGLETTLHLSTIFPAELEGRKEVRAKPANALGSRVQFSIEQMRSLGMLCLRLEALATSRIFRHQDEKPKETRRVRDSMADEPEETPSKFLYGNPDMLLPAMKDSMSGTELMLLLDSMAGRIENAVRSMNLGPQTDPLTCREGAKDSLGAALIKQAGLDIETLQKVLSVLRGI